MYIKQNIKLEFIVAFPICHQHLRLSLASAVAINTLLDTSSSTEPVSSLTALEVGVVAVIWMPWKYQ